jgi:hypothetical protein
MTEPRRKRADSPRLVFSVAMPLSVERKVSQAARIRKTSRNGMIVSAAELVADQIIAEKKAQDAA